LAGLQVRVTVRIFPDHACIKALNGFWNTSSTFKDGLNDDGLLQELSNLQDESDNVVYAGLRLQIDQGGNS
jgi:hypothetical protein